MQSTASNLAKKEHLCVSRMKQVSYHSKSCSLTIQYLTVFRMIRKQPTSVDFLRQIEWCVLFSMNVGLCLVCTETNGSVS